MSRDMNTQVREYTQFFQGTIDPVDMEEILHQRVGDGAVRHVGAVRSTHRRGWVTAAVAAMATVIVLGSVAWLSRSDGDAPAVHETPPTTAAVIPTTEAAITTDTVAATTTTLAAAPIVPPGEGPKFSFVEAIPPSDRALSGGGRWFGEWFDGSLFVPSGEELFRSTDGLTWALVPGLPASGDVQDYMLQADEDRIVNVVMPESDGPIRINISTNGDDWLSSTIDVPIFGQSNGAGEFRWADPSNMSHSVLAVGPQGIVLAASMTLQVDGERFANSLVDPNAGIHVEIIDLDLERSVIILAYLDEEKNMEQIGDLREIYLNSTGFGRDYAEILKAMAADPDWEPAVDRVVSMFPDNGYATAVVHYEWFSSDGTSWQRLPTTAGPLDGGQFASVLATPTGFVATAVNGVVWESTNGTAWIEANDRGNRHASVNSNLVAWQGAVVEHTTQAATRGDDSEVWTLTDPPNKLFADIPTKGMRLKLTKRGLIGTPTYGWEGPDKMEILFSSDGESWNRWEPSEFGQNAESAEAWIVGVGDDFVVIQVRDLDASNENTSYGLWVGTIP